MENEPNSRPIRVKFMTKAPASDKREYFLQMFPGEKPEWGRCQFIFDQLERDYDWMVVYDDMPSVSGERFTLWEEALACPREHTMLITSEPSTIKTYGHHFHRQFGHVLTSQEPWAIRHPGAIYAQTGMVWFYGKLGRAASYDYLLEHCPTEKTHEVSTVCSSKRQKHTLHNKRYAFSKWLQERLPQMEHYGHGVRYIDDKSDALDYFKYHLTIENHYCAHHWTEKLADCYLGLCLPLYYGCPNLADYFPEESFVPIDLFNYEESLEIIQRVIRDKEYEKRLPAIKEARRLYLEKYCTFANLSGLIERLHQPARVTQAGVNILSRHALRRSSLLQACSFGVEKFSAQVRHKLGLG